MSTRAVIIRKNAAGELEYGQTKYDGMNNTALLNENFKSADVVDKLFARMSKQGILSLGCGLDCTDWYDEGDTYNYGRFVPAVDDLMPHALRQFFLRYLDWAEFASIWDGDKWINFDTHNVDACSAFLLRLFGFNHEEEAPVTKRTCVEPAPFPKKKYRVELELFAEDIDFVAVSIRLQKLLAPLEGVRSGKMSITEIHDDKKF